MPMMDSNRRTLTPQSRQGGRRPAAEDECFRISSRAESIALHICRQSSAIQFDGEKLHSKRHLRRPPGVKWVESREEKRKKLKVHLHKNTRIDKCYTTG